MSVLHVNLMKVRQYRCHHANNFVITTAFYLQINQTQVQINLCQIQINLCQIQINLCQIQINLCQIQINPF